MVRIFVTHCYDSILYFPPNSRCTIFDSIFLLPVMILRDFMNVGFRFANPDETLPVSNGYRTIYFDLKPLIDILPVQSN